MYDFSGQIRKVEAGNVSMKAEADEAVADANKDVIKPARKTLAACLAVVFLMVRCLCLFLCCFITLQRKKHKSDKADDLVRIFLFCVPVSWS